MGAILLAMLLGLVIPNDLSDNQLAGLAIVMFIIECIGYNFWYRIGYNDRGTKEDWKETKEKEQAQIDELNDKFKEAVQDELRRIEKEAKKEVGV